MAQRTRGTEAAGAGGGRRVLIAGVANFWGSGLAARLERDPAVEHVVGLDVRPPTGELRRTRFLEADLRSPGLTAALADLDVDTVVHNDIHQFPTPGRTARQLHDVNVIGTLQLLAACERMPSLRSIVVRGSAAIYGSEPASAQFYTEDLAGAHGGPPLRTRFQRDVGELEALCETFVRRRPAVVCTVLRYQPVVGPSLDTPITRLVRSPVVPTFMGFDPRVQLLHEEDSIEALAAAVRRPVRGAVNVAGPGAISLSRALRRLGRVAVPIPSPLWGPVVGAAGRVAGPPVSEDTARYLRYGRVVDVTRMREELRFEPRFDTEACVEAMAGAPPPAPVAPVAPAATPAPAGGP